MEECQLPGRDRFTAKKCFQRFYRGERGSEKNSASPERNRFSGKSIGSPSKNTRGPCFQLQNVCHPNSSACGYTCCWLCSRGQPGSLPDSMPPSYQIHRLDRGLSL